MAAIVTLNEHNTVTPDTRTDKTSGTIRCRTNVSALVDTNNPIQKPGTGLFNRSYEKWLQLRIGATGPSVGITNIQFYTTGSTGTGASVFVRTANPGAYATPVTPPNDSSGTLATTFTSGSRKSMGAGPYTSTETNIGEFCVLWMTLDDSVSAPQSPTSTLNLWFSYDEV